MADLMNITVDENTKNKTPIEIAMQIDEDGMTTASALYEWLELNPAHYARWCKSNITENNFAIDGEDYIPIEPSNGAFTINGERENTGVAGNPNPKTDYYITANFAKKLAMLTKSKRGEVARRYFLKIEKTLAITTKQYNELCNKYNELCGKYNEMSHELNELSRTINRHLDDYAEIKKLVVSNNPPISIWEKDAKEKIKEYKEGLVVEWMRNMDDDFLLDQICQGRDIDQNYYKEKYITETQDRYPTKLRYLIHYSVPRREIFDFLDSCIRSHNEALYD